MTHVRCTWHAVTNAKSHRVDRSTVTQRGFPRAPSLLFVWWSHVPCFARYWVSSHERRNVSRSLLKPLQIAAMRHSLRRVIAGLYCRRAAIFPWMRLHNVDISKDWALDGKHCVFSRLNKIDWSIRGGPLLASLHSTIPQKHLKVENEKTEVRAVPILVFNY